MLATLGGVVFVHPAFLRCSTLYVSVLIVICHILVPSLWSSLSTDSVPHVSPAAVVMSLNRGALLLITP